ncbi:acyl carrier protein phosphodiesterase [Photobacterium sp. GSS17]|uniref:acyl carrier protein phosphodiesterase n=1 Tax=Photobacterium sp. GSS17 TaxID=3020715 RepID=UPI0023629A50|nr:ACP phosphodiesterase [Photobacterium sp. GSS17]
MNFLAHLHLAEQCQSHLAGNLLADFVRGNPDQQFRQDVADGIRLHRFIDSYIDALPEVLECRRLFDTDTRRVSGIALDITWDHFLARHWTQFHPQPLTEFVRTARREVEQFSDPAPEQYLATMARMWQQNWLEQYKHVSTLERALQRMALRRPRLNQLAACPDVILAHYPTLEQQFFVIYPQVSRAARQFRQQQLQP